MREQLLPRPKRLQLAGSWVSARRLVLDPPPASLVPCAWPLQRVLDRTDPGDVPLCHHPDDLRRREVLHLELALAEDGLFGPQSYRLRLSEALVRVEGADVAGLRHGCATLAQLWALRRADHAGGWPALPALEIEDWPDLPVRAVLLDISRDRVPTMETLRELVLRLSQWKINQLQLYTEHSFAYQGHEAVWRHADPLTAEQVRELDAVCADLGLELVPNQQSFGHMHRWLKHPAYRHLAECPEGIEHPFSLDVEPYSLCPEDPGSLELLGQLYDQLLPNFSSRQLNTGLDETFDLGRCRSADSCARRGREQVYLDFLRQIHALVRARGHRMQIWADMLLERPEMLQGVPRDVTALLWGYEAEHPFAEQAAQLQQAGLGFCICPGTSSWNALGGRLDNMLRNVGAAARCAQQLSADGLLVADWGDNGHLQPLATSLPGLATAAALSWDTTQAHERHELPLAQLLNRHVLHDATGATGEALLQLADLYRATGVTLKNGNLLSRLLLRPEAWTPGLHRGLSSESLAHTEERLGQAMDLLRLAAPTATDGAILLDELRFIGQAYATACQLGRVRLSRGFDLPLEALPAADREPLAQLLVQLLESHRALWTRRSRPGGLADSCRRLERTRAALAR